jgi:hypothetical protein
MDIANPLKLKFISFGWSPVSRHVYSEGPCILKGIVYNSILFNPFVATIVATAVVHDFVLGIHRVYQADIFRSEVVPTAIAMDRFLACHD